MCFANFIFFLFLLPPLLWATQFKYLNVIIKNLADPSKSQDVKYRTLNLENSKLSAGLFSIAAMMEVLTNVIGFTTAAAANAAALAETSENNNQNTNDGGDATTSNSTDPVKTLVLPLEKLPPSDVLQNWLSSILEVQHRLKTTTTAANNNNAGSSSSSNKRIVEHPLDKLSEKQKARRLLEEKEKVDKIKAKEERKRNLTMLKEDKHRRENDPTWKPGVSAACAKSGTGLQSFRDRHGE